MLMFSSGRLGGRVNVVNVLLWAARKRINVVNVLLLL